LTFLQPLFPDFPSLVLPGPLSLPLVGVRGPRFSSPFPPTPPFLFVETSPLYPWSFFFTIGFLFFCDVNVKLSPPASHAMQCVVSLCTPTGLLPFLGVPLFSLFSHPPCLYTKNVSASLRSCRFCPGLCPHLFPDIPSRALESRTFEHAGPNFASLPFPLLSSEAAFLVQHPPIDPFSPWPPDVRSSFVKLFSHSFQPPPLKTQAFWLGLFTQFSLSPLSPPDRPPSHTFPLFVPNESCEGSDFFLLLFLPLQLFTENPNSRWRSFLPR